VDLAAEVGERALEVIRGAIEAGAAAEKEAAAQRLLRELEEEDAGKKARRPARGARRPPAAPAQPSLPRRGGSSWLRRVCKQA
jgi:hypothetical protein